MKQNELEEDLNFVLDETQLCFYSCGVQLFDFLKRKIIKNMAELNILAAESYDGTLMSRPYDAANPLWVPFSCIDWAEKGNFSLAETNAYLEQLVKAGYIQLRKVRATIDPVDRTSDEYDHEREDDVLYYTLTSEGFENVIPELPED